MSLNLPRFGALTLALVLLAACSGKDPIRKTQLDAGSEDNPDVVVVSPKPDDSAIDPRCADFECGPRETCKIDDDEPTCVCLSGFEGEDCETNVNECAADTNRCGAFGGCVDFEGSFACLCDDSAVFDDGSCADIDECASANPCATGASCDDTGSVVECSCPEGTFGNGRFCDGEDHCAGADCGAGACTPVPGGFVCDCLPGTTGASCELSDCTSIEFADSDLEAAVISQLLTSAPVNASTLGDGSLRIGADLALSSLGGLECLVELTSLGLTNQTLSSLDEVAPLTRLEELDLSCSSGFSLPLLEKFPLLRRFFFDFSECETKGSLSDLSAIASAPQLQELSLGGHSFTSLTPLASLKSLRTLVLRGASVDLAPLSKLPSLRKLDIAGSDPARATFAAKLPGLTSLSLASTDLDSLDGVEFSSMLRELDLSNNALVSLEGVSFPSALYSLDLRGNEISSLAGAKFPSSLLSLNLWGNPLDELDSLLGSDLPPGLEIWVSTDPLTCEDLIPAREALFDRGIALITNCD